MITLATDHRQHAFASSSAPHALQVFRRSRRFRTRAVWFIAGVIVGDLCAVGLLALRGLP